MPSRRLLSNNESLFLPLRELDPESESEPLLELDEVDLLDTSDPSGWPILDASSNSSCGVGAPASV